MSVNTKLIWFQINSWYQEHIESSTTSCILRSYFFWKFSLFLSSLCNPPTLLYQDVFQVTKDRFIVDVQLYFFLEFSFSLWIHHCCISLRVQTTVFFYELPLKSVINSHVYTKSVLQNDSVLISNYCRMRRASRFKTLLRLELISSMQQVRFYGVLYLQSIFHIHKVLWIFSIVPHSIMWCLSLCWIKFFIYHLILLSLFRPSVTIFDTCYNLPYKVTLKKLRKSCIYDKWQSTAHKILKFCKLKHIVYNNIHVTKCGECPR